MRLLYIMSKQKLHIMYDVIDDSRTVLTESAYRTRGYPTTITVADTGERSVKQSPPRQKYVINAHGGYDAPDGSYQKILPYNCLIYHYSKYGEELYCSQDDDTNICNNLINIVWSNNKNMFKVKNLKS